MVVLKWYKGAGVVTVLGIRDAKLNSCICMIENQNGNIRKRKERETETETGCLNE